MYFLEIRGIIENLSSNNKLFCFEKKFLYYERVINLENTFFIILCVNCLFLFLCLNFIFEIYNELYFLMYL